MQNYHSRIEQIREFFPPLQSEKFTTAPSGTHFKVFLSDNYAVRFRDDSPDLLTREADFLKGFNHPLIPVVVWLGKVDGFPAMVEERLPGEGVDSVWKTLTAANKQNIIEQMIEFLHYLRTQEKACNYSVQTGKEYETFLECLLDKTNRATHRIEKFGCADKMLEDLLSITNDPELKHLFKTQMEPHLVHGDLIIHNLLTDGENLTGVLDWELALLGDPEYDLCRLFYYQECAKAYQEQGTDDTFEADYMDRLMVKILDSNLIEDREVFQRKYHFIRALFYLNSLNWAANSDKPQENLDELVEQWVKRTAPSGGFPVDTYLQGTFESLPL